MTTAVTLRALLVVDMLAMAALAFVYLSQRRLSWVQFCSWGLLALMVPLLGPFLVILFRPGVWRNPGAPARLPRILPARLQVGIFAVLGPKRRSRFAHRR